MLKPLIIFYEHSQNLGEDIPGNEILHEHT